MASPPTTFHCFRNLPPECRLLIWTFYGDARSGTRHCFSVDGTTLLYAALSSGDFSLFDNSASGFDGVDDWAQARPSEPFEVIEPANKFSVLAHLAHPSIMFKHTRDSRASLARHLRDRAVRGPTAPQIWVNFTEDVFYFDWCRDDAPSFQWPPSWFRALHPGMDNTVSRVLKDDHWLFKVQKLALKISHDAPQRDLPILKRMTQLKLLQLVVHIDCSQVARDWKAARWPDDVFIPDHHLDDMDLSSVVIPGSTPEDRARDQVQHESEKRGWLGTRAEATRQASNMKELGLISAEIDIVLHIC